MRNTPQVPKAHYQFESYCYPERWASYYHQLRETLTLQPENVLEVGVGDGVLKNYITQNTSIPYTSVDIAPDLHPDVIGSVTDLPIKDKSYDVVCAFEILEHLPFSQFETAVGELKRVARRCVVLSLPHFGPSIKLSFKIPFMNEVRIAYKVPFLKKHVFNGEHYWEIGKKGYPPSRVIKVLKSYFSEVHDFVPFDSQYHHFFICQVKD